MMLLTQTADITATIINAVASVGFPIAMCFAMGWYIKDTSDKNNENSKQYKQKQLLELEKQTTALENIAASLDDMLREGRNK